MTDEEIIAAIETKLPGWSFESADGRAMIRRHGPGWLVSGFWRGNWHGGVTYHDPQTPSDPIDWAARMHAMIAVPSQAIAEAPSRIAAPSASEGLPNGGAPDAGRDPEQIPSDEFQRAAALDDTNPPSSASVDGPVRAGPLPLRDVEPLSDVPLSGPAYPGVMVLPDEIGARRNAVIAAVTFAERDRLAAACDSSRWQTLSQAWQDVHNADALGAPVSPQQRFSAGEFIALRNRADAIRAHADRLRDAAMTAPGDLLKAMHEDLGSGWP